MQLCSDVYMKVLKEESGVFTLEKLLRKLFCEIFLEIEYDKRWKKEILWLHNWCRGRLVKEKRKKKKHTMLRDVCFLCEGGKGDYNVIF